MKAISLIPKYLSKSIRAKYEQKSTAANLPVELLTAIFSSSLCYIPGPLPEDEWGLSELYDVTCGGCDRKKALLSAASVCRAWNQVAAVLLYEKIYISSIKTLELLLKTLKSQSWQKRQLRISDIVLHLIRTVFMGRSRWRARVSRSALVSNTLAALGLFAPTARVHLHSSTAVFGCLRNLAVVNELTRLENIESLHLNKSSLPTNAPGWPGITADLLLPSLRTLSLSNMYIHESGLSDENFPSLTRLKITRCSFSEVENSSLARLSDLYIYHSHTGWGFIQHLIRASTETLEFLAIKDNDPLSPRSNEQPDIYVPLEVRQQVSTLPHLRKLFLDGYFFPCSLPVLDIPPSVEEFSVSPALRALNEHIRTTSAVIDHVLRRIECPNDSQLKAIHVSDLAENWSHAELKDITSRCTDLGVRFDAGFKYLNNVNLLLNA